MGNKRLRILYGYSASGSGHRVRAAQLVRDLEGLGAKVDCLSSGHHASHDENKFQFQNIRRLSGLKYEQSKDGGLDALRTSITCLKRAPILLRDVLQLDLSGYDVVVNDFEPITAWAAKIKKRVSIGISHHVALSNRSVPTSAKMQFIGKTFAPSKISLGMHWGPFGTRSIIPPILRDMESVCAIPKKNLVYLPWENLHQIHSFLAPFSRDKNFHVYSPKVQSPFIQDNICYSPISEKFQTDLETCEGVIANAGFMTCSEALFLGKRLLVKPIKNQPEQELNAMTIASFGLGTAMMRDFDASILARWLFDCSEAPRVRYRPDVSQLLAEWIVEGDLENVDSLTSDLWAGTTVEGLHRDFLCN